MNKIIKHFGVLLFLVSAPLVAEEVTQDSAEQLRQKQEKIMQLEIELLELKLDNEKKKVESLEKKVDLEKKLPEEKAVVAQEAAIEEKKKEGIVDEEFQQKADSKIALAKPEVDTINDDFKIRLGASYLYDNELIVDRGNYGFDFSGIDEGKMIAEKTTEGSLEIQSPHLYFTLRSKFGILFSSGYQGFEFDRQEINYTDYENGTIVDLGTRAEGELIYLTPMIFINPLRNVSVNQSLVIGFGLGLSHIRAKGATQLTEPFYSGSSVTRNYNINEAGLILKLALDYQWKNLFAGLFFQSSVVSDNGDDFIYTSGGINAGISFQL